MSNGRRFASDQEALLIEARHRAEVNMENYINNLEHKVKEFNNAKEAFVNEYKKNALGLAFNVTGAKFMGARRDPERAKAFSEAQSRIKEMRRNLMAPSMWEFASDSDLKRMMALQKKLGVDKL